MLLSGRAVLQSPEGCCFVTTPLQLWCSSAFEQDTEAQIVYQVYRNHKCVSGLMLM